MNNPEFSKLAKVINQLRDPVSGCPWDLEQTHKTLKKFLLEESYELIEAIDEDNYANMKDELGDVLLQILLHSKMAEEKGVFNFEDVCQNLSEKMIRRHPHVFKDKEAISSDKVLQNWDQIKKTEINNAKSIIDKKLLTFPALFSAYKIGKKTNRIGFDWSSADEVKEKVIEEWNEFCVEFTNNNKKNYSEELGDFIFTVAQLARHLDLEPEEILRNANKKFVTRFQVMEKLIQNDDLDIHDLSQSEMEQYWKKVKQIEKTN